MHHFTVGIRGRDLDVNRLVGDLEVAGMFAEVRPEAEHLVLAHLDAESAQEAKAHVSDALPEGEYAVDQPVEID